MQCEFVEVPPELASTMSYNAVLCGAVRGALEQVQMRVECTVKVGSPPSTPPPLILVSSPPRKSPPEVTV